MTLSPLELLAAKQEQRNAKVEEIEAVRSYWSHRVELERPIGGRLEINPYAQTAKDSAKENRPDEKKPASEHEHHNHQKGAPQ